MADIPHEYIEKALKLHRAILGRGTNFTAETIAKALMKERESASLPDDWTVSDTETAGVILNYLGRGQEASKDPYIDPRRDHIARIIRARIDAASGSEIATYQARLAAAHDAVFYDDPTDVTERLARFLEEALETCQAFGMPAEDAHKLVDYTFSRPVGEQRKEIGAVLLTLASLCVVAGYGLMECGNAELSKFEHPETVQRIRAKRATRHGRGPLPGFDPAAFKKGNADG